MKENWRSGNQVELLINGEDFFPRVFEAIENAKREVLLETFIFNEDKVGFALQRALIKAASNGARVEVTVDDYGSADLTQPFIDEMVKAGVNIHVFDPTPRFLGVRVNIFRRLHRKIVVVDEELAFVGGINYVADHLGDYGPKAKQDYAVQVRGPIVQDIRNASLKLLGEKRPGSKKTESVGDAQSMLALRDNIFHKRDIERHYLRAINGAQKRLIIANAYFFPGYRLLRSIRRAARRGVKVKLILQGQPDMPWVTVCTRLLYGYLLREGVVIHEYCRRPLHGKIAIADDEWATVGSSNLDPLSLALNLEANLFFKSRDLNQQLYEHLMDMAHAHCKPVDMEFAQRGYWWRLPLVFLGFHFVRRFPLIAGWLPAHAPVLELLNEKVSNKHNVDDVEEPS